MNKYSVLGIVGEGTYGVVIRCRHKESGQERAIKKFRESEDDEAVRKTAVREVKILKMLRHRSIVRLHEAFRRKGRLYLVFEYMPKNLLEVMEEHPRGLGVEVTRTYLHQLVHAIDWCHQHSVVHRDIKPENLLVDPARGTMKLCDFGFSRMLPADGAAAGGVELTDYVATRWYRSPELLLALTQYGYEVDIWAIGCIMGELLDGVALFPGESDIDQLYIIQTVRGPLTERHKEAFLSCELYTGVQLPEVAEDAIVGLEEKYEGKLDEMAVDFMSSVLAIDSDERMTAEQCTDHPFFDGLAEATATAGLAAPPQQQLQQSRDVHTPGSVRRMQRRQGSGGGAGAAAVGLPPADGVGDSSQHQRRPLPASVYRNSWRNQAIKPDQLHRRQQPDRQRSASVPTAAPGGNSGGVSMGGEDLERGQHWQRRSHSRGGGGGQSGSVGGQGGGEGADLRSPYGQQGSRPSSQGGTWEDDHRHQQHQRGHPREDPYGSRHHSGGSRLGGLAGLKLPTPVAHHSSQAAYFTRDGCGGGGGRAKGTGLPSARGRLPIFLQQRQLPALGVAVPQSHSRRPLNG